LAAALAPSGGMALVGGRRVCVSEELEQNLFFRITSRYIRPVSIFVLFIRFIVSYSARKIALFKLLWRFPVSVAIDFTRLSL
jgi:hypothetical protein